MFIWGLHVPPDLAAYKYLPMFNKVFVICLWWTVISDIDGQKFGGGFSFFLFFFCINQDFDFLSFKVITEDWSEWSSVSDN